MTTLYYSVQTACVFVYLVFIVDALVAKTRVITLLSLPALIGIFFTEMIREDFHPVEAILFIAVWLNWHELAINSRIPTRSLYEV